MSNLSFNRIVQINVTQQYAPQPNRLQQSAAIVSQASTSFAAGSINYIGSPSSLSSNLIAGAPITGAVWAAGVVTLTFGSAHGVTVGSTTPVIVTEMVPTGYNGSFIATAATTTTLTYALATDPGAEASFGRAVFGPSAWLVAADNTWWAQNGQQTGYFLFESGSADVPDTLTAVETFIDENPQTIYNWGFLPGVDADSVDALAFFNLHNTLSSLVKFYLPVNQTTYPTWAAESNLINVFAMIQSPIYGPATELDSVAYMAFITNIVPTPTNKLPPSSYAYLYGVTAYSGLTQTLITTFADGNINYVSTGAEGGISNTILIQGDNLDGSPANVAYSIDWQQINLNLDLSNAVINGSNSTINPLYYNQNGIDRLQAVAANTAARGIATGLALGQVVLTQLDPTVFAQNLSSGLYAGNYVINAVPFAFYVAQNPSDYSQGLYGGLQASFVPQYGFKRIVFNLQATQFA